MSGFNSFNPTYQGSVTITVTTSSAATALTHPGRSRVVVYNAGSEIVFLEFGASGVASAVASGYPVGPGMKETISIDPANTHVAAISGTTGQTLYVSVGAGE